MINLDILYLKKGNRSTTIKLKNNQEILINNTLKEVLNNYCLKDLTTIEGRMKATSQVFNIRKHIPIYLSENLVLIPTKNKKEIDNIYINCYSVIDMIKDEEKTKVIFSDFSELIVNQPIRLLTKYYDNGLKIKKSNEMIF